MLKLITKNIYVKIFCLIAATAMWLYVASGQSAVGKFPGSIKIRAINVPSGLVAIFDNQTVDIKITADSATWKKLSADSFSAYVDMSSYSEGTYNLNVNVVCSVSGVQIVEKTPDKIYVNLEKVITKLVSVNKKIEGNAAEGKVAGKIVFDPVSVEAKGPASMIENLTEAMSTIKLNGESDDFTKTVSVYALDEQGDQINEIQFYPSEVKASVSIVKASNVKTIGIKPRIEGTPKPGYFVSSITVTPSVVDVTGDKSLMNNLTYIETAIVNISDTDNDIEKDVSLSVPSGIVLQPGSSNKVRLKIVISSNTVTQDFKATITPLNLNNLSASYNPSEITVKLSGPPAVISSLRNDNVLLNLDFSGKNNLGSYQFDLSASNISVPSNVKIEDFSPKSLIATLR